MGNRTAIGSRQSAVGRRTLPLDSLLPIPLLLAAALRLFALGRESLWLDEATTVFMAHMDVGTLLAHAAADVHPPLYPLLMRGWVAVLGESETALRGFSVLAGWLTLPLLYALARRLFGRGVGLLAVWLLAWSPLHIAYAQEARMYALAALWVTASALALLYGLERGGRWWVAYGILLALGFYTHYVALFAPIVHALYIGHVAVRRRLSRRRILGWLAGVAGAGALFLPWLPTFLQQTARGGGEWIALIAGQPTLRALLDTAMEFTAGPGGTYPRLVGLAGVALALGLTAVAVLRRGEASATPSPVVFALLCGWGALGVAWLVSQWRPVFLSRYLLAFLPGTVLLLAAGVAALPRRGLQAVALAGLLALNLLSLSHVYGDVQKPDWRAAADAIAATTPETAVPVFVLPGWDAKALDYYAQGRWRIVPGPIVEDGADAMPQVLVATMAGANRLWVVWARPYPTRPQAEAMLREAGFAPVMERAFYGIEGLALYER